MPVTHPALLTTLFLFFSLIAAVVIFLSDPKQTKKQTKTKQMKALAANISVSVCTHIYEYMSLCICLKSSIPQAQYFSLFRKVY